MAKDLRKRSIIHNLRQAQRGDWRGHQSLKNASGRNTRRLGLGLAEGSADIFYWKRLLDALSWQSEI